MNCSGFPFAAVDQLHAECRVRTVGLHPHLADGGGKRRVRPRAHQFEFTEDERLDVAHVKRIVAEYKRLGFKVALDDFGSGYNGLSLLADFQPDIIKIDMHLVRGIDHSPARQAIVAGIVGIARELDIQVMAKASRPRPNCRC